MTSLLPFVVTTLLVFTAILATTMATTDQEIATQRHHHPHQRHPQHQPKQHQHLAHPRQHRRQDLSSNQRQKEAPAVRVEQSQSLSLPQQQRNANATTRLRRLSARDYYNKVVQRRQNAHRSLGSGGNPEWAYNTYNVQSNTFGAPPPPPPPSGKGDDNTHDVEFISSSGPTRRVHVTAPPPPSAPIPALVPVRRGYATAAPPPSDMLPPHTTEDPFETNANGRNYPSDPKELERWHICVQQRTVTMPVKTTEVYTRPIWKHINTPCPPPQNSPNQMCTRVQLVHEQAFRDVVRHKSAQQLSYDCCVGWMRETPNADACMKPICSSRCQNGGSCSGPETCTCPVGFAGRYCEHDTNECKEEKPCDQTCINTVGSYYCKCREGFVLQSDQQSCKKIDLHEDDAFEARDLENEIETGEDVAARLQKIERSLANEKVHGHELQKTLHATYNMVDSLKSRLNTLEKQQQDMNRLQTNLFATESRTNKLEGMVNLLMKCRSGAPNAHCP